MTPRRDDRSQQQRGGGGGQGGGGGGGGGGSQGGGGQQQQQQHQQHSRAPQEGQARRGRSGGSVRQHLKTMSAMRGPAARRGGPRRVRRGGIARGAWRRSARRIVSASGRPFASTSSSPVSELAEILKIPATQIVGFAFKNLGLMVTINQRLDFDQIELIAGEFGFQAVREAEYAAGCRSGHRGRQGRGPRFAAAGRHDHGSRRPRQDVAPRLHPQGERRRRRGRWHHAAHRRVPRHAAERQADHVPRHAGSRSVHRHARPRRAGDRHRRARRRGGRLGDAADDRGDLARQERRRAAHRRDQQDRPA